MTPIILVHYNEIALKGNNRRWFEELLLRNIRYAMRMYKYDITMEYGRFIVSGIDEEQHINELLPLLQSIPGIAALLVGIQVSTTIEGIESAVSAVAAQQQFTSFAIDTHRIDKRFSYNSMEMNKRLGTLVVNTTGATVDLQKPDIRITVTITGRACYVTWKKVHGREGLPVNSSGKILSLISAGIDSPVASSMMLTRGLQVVYLHFHSYPLTSRASIEIVKQLTNHIHRHQPPTVLLLAPLGPVQQQIVTHAPPSYRVLLYRRAMFYIAQQCAVREQCTALCTGESVGQVASQTIQNMNIATECVRLPILRPLIGMNKSEIVERSRRLGTYELSTQPYEDCCSLLVPKRVETHGQLEKVHAIEKTLQWDALIQSILDSIERQKIV